MTVCLCVCVCVCVQLIVNVIDVNDNAPMFPLSQYIVQGVAETITRGTDIIQGSHVLTPACTPLPLIHACVLIL